MMHRPLHSGAVARPAGEDRPAEAPTDLDRRRTRGYAALHPRQSLQAGTVSFTYLLMHFRLSPPRVNGLEFY